MTKRLSRVRGSAFLLLAVAAALPAMATEVQTTIDVAQEQSEISAPDGTGIELTIERAIERAVERNLGLVVQRYRRSVTIQGIEEALGIYDFTVGGTVGLSSEARPPATTLENATVVTTEGSIFNISLSKLLPSGANARLDFNNRRTEFSDQFIQPNPQLGIDFDISINQPLLRDRGRRITEQRILIARNNTAISFDDFRTQVEILVQQVANAYWELVEARRQLEVAEESLELAKELHEMNRIQVEVGTLAPLEMVQSEVGVATREEDIILRQAALEERADLLRRFYNLDRGELWEIEIVPVSEPSTDYLEIDVARAVDTALENRPDVTRKKLENDSRAIDAEVAHNQTRPSLDLGATFGFNGLAGDLTIEPPGMPPMMFDAGYGDAFEQITGGDFEGWQVGLTFSYPIGNRAAKARSVQADLIVEQGEAELRDLEQDILTIVRSTARAVKTAEKAIDSAKVSSKLATKNLDAERKRYENGLSTSFRVLEIQEDLSEARSREVSAIIAHRKSLVAFYRSIGTLLDENDIELVNEQAADDS